MYLDFSSNEITQMTEHAFDLLAHLEILYLKGNPINRIDPSTFSKMKNLLLLDLSEETLDDSSKRVYDEQRQACEQRLNVTIEKEKRESE